MQEERTRPLEPTRPRRLRRIFQFSLRTLLILTTLAAVGCWWYLQPKVHVEQLAGTTLKLRRQVRAVQPERPALVTCVPTERFVNVGSWQLRDEHDEPLAIGRYKNDRPHGRWTVYHPNARKAAEGRLFHGLRIGVWKTWDEQGRRESEVTYALVKQIVGPTSPEAIAQAGPLVKVVPRSHIGGILKNGVADYLIRLPNMSERHGPARFWHPNGQLKCEGLLQRDLREGKWAFYGELGQIAESGKYQRGLRQGPWLIRDKISGQTQTIEFVRNRPRAEFDRLIAELKAEIASGNLDRQIRAMQRLDALGELAVPLFIELLHDPSNDVKLMALRRLESISDPAGEFEQPLTQFPLEKAIATIEPLVQSADDRLARLAGYWLYRVSPAHRDTLYARLIALARRSHDTHWKQEVLQTIYKSDASRRHTTFAELANAADCRMSLATTKSAATAGCFSSVRPTVCPFITIAPQCENLEPLIKSAFKSTDVKVRWFAIMVIDQLAMREPIESEWRREGALEIRHRIPAAYQELIEQAKKDSDGNLREAAEQAGKRTLSTVVG